MDLSKVKLVVSDMDGTLLNSKHEVSDRFFVQFKELKERGILFAAASGRQYHSIVHKLKPIKEDIIVIAENGGFAMQQDREILSTPLPNIKKNEILSLLEKLDGIHVVLCGKQRAHLLRSDLIFVNKLKEYYNEYELLGDLKTFDGEILKIAIYHPESSEHFIYPAVHHLEGELKVKVSGANWVDISSPNAHKGYALDIVQKENGITPAETMVFGDYNNDLEMLALADFSFAMENAHPTVKKVANYNTASNDDFGVELILDKLIGK